MSEKRWRNSVVAGLLLLAGLLAGWGIKSGSWPIAVSVIPLLAVLPGIAKANLYTFRVVSLLIIAYLLLGLVEGFTANEYRAWAVSVLLVSGFLFVAVLGYVRARLTV